ncbi:MAG: aminotransferase class V-fold PLP-dependent enzyme [Candidatus Bipolaricaulota bacterium]|nr:aminotransferase class V-fold PLP-dependent enzyme [Candidatus Bipolaricaulota bacterium]
MYNIERVRNDFPALHKMVFFGSASVGPLPRVAMVAMQRYSKELRVDFASAAWEADPVAEVRSLAAQLINSSPEEIVATTSTSAGINLLAGAIHWKRHDNIVINDLEYPANVFPWLHQAHKHALEVRVVHAHGGVLPLSEMTAAIDRKTRVLAVSHVEFGTGFRNDIPALAKAVHKTGGLICVDASQSLGVLPVDVQEMGIDVLATGGYKWLCGPVGSGFTYIRKDLAKGLTPATIDYADITADAHEAVWNALVSGKEYAMPEVPLQRDAQRFQLEGLSPIAIKGLASSLSYILDLGSESIEERITELVDYLIKRLRAAKIGILSPTAPEKRAGIVTVSIPYNLSKPKDTHRLEQKLQDARIIAHPRGGGLRLAVHFFNTEEEIDLVVDFITSL